jgi:DNA repair photolyase
MWMDRKYKVTLELLKILNFYRYPCVVFTRSDLVAAEEYLRQLNPKLASVQMSVSGENEELTKVLEPGAPSVTRRLAALKQLRNAGVWTAVRINPLFPTFPDGYFTDRESLSARFEGGQIPKFPLLDIESAPDFMSKIAETGNNTLLAGFVRLNQTSISQVSKATGINFKKFFKPENYMPQGESHYSNSEIAAYYQLLHRSTKASGMRFTTCYIGNGLKDYYQHQNLWANKSDCCDVIGNVPAFKTSAQEIPWDERKKFAPGYCKVDEVEKLDTSFELSTKLGREAVEKGFSRIKWQKK